MFKKIKIDLSAGIAFALMFATSVDVVAQEKINASNVNSEVTEPAQAKVSSGTVQKLDIESTSIDPFAVGKIAIAKTMVSDFIVQLATNSFEGHSNPSSGSCTGAPSSRFCVYEVTTLGKSNISGDGPFTDADIDDFLEEEYITPQQTAQLRIWEPEQ